MSESRGFPAVQPEHKILWASQAVERLPDNAASVRGFFARFAKRANRSFPWRAPDTTPFELLTAEMLLVQTKAEDVARVWPTLMKRYPSPERLARAQALALSRLLQPLGLQNQRARALKAMSRA